MYPYFGVYVSVRTRKLLEPCGTAFQSTSRTVGSTRERDVHIFPKGSKYPNIEVWAPKYMKPMWPYAIIFGYLDPLGDSLIPNLRSSPETTQVPCYGLRYVPRLRAVG